MVSVTANLSPTHNLSCAYSLQEELFSWLRVLLLLSEKVRSRISKIFW